MDIDTKLLLLPFPESPLPNEKTKLFSLFFKKNVHNHDKKDNIIL